MPAGPAAGSDLQVEKVSRGGASGDYDNDGDTDIVLVNLNDAPTLLRNEGGNAGFWLGLELEGKPATGMASEPAFASRSRGARKPRKCAALTVTYRVMTAVCCSVWATRNGSTKWRSPGRPVGCNSSKTPVSDNT